jgi:hypothetical protein
MIARIVSYKVLAGYSGFNLYFRKGIPMIPDISLFQLILISVIIVSLVWLLIRSQVWLLLKTRKQLRDKEEALQELERTGV